MITWSNWMSPSTRCPLASVTLAIALNAFPFAVIGCLRLSASLKFVSCSLLALGLAGMAFSSRSELASRLATCSLLLSNMPFSTLENWLLEPLACMWVTTDAAGKAPAATLRVAPLLLLISSLAFGCGDGSDFLWRASFRNRLLKPLGFLKPLKRPLRCTSGLVDS